MALRLGVVMTNIGNVVVTMDSKVGTVDPIETMAELVISPTVVNSVTEVVDTRLVDPTKKDWVEA